MKTVTPVLALLLACAPSLHADSFGDGALEIEFVEIGGAGNPASALGFGRVDHDYRMAKHEVSAAQIEAYNSLSGGEAIIVRDMTGYGGNAPDKPASGVSWNEAARFVNWLNELKGFPPAYKFTSDGVNDDIALWTAGEDGFDPANPYRNSKALYFLPSEDEWFKAAYYDDGAGVYWSYPTGSNSAPIAVASGTAPGTAVYGQLESTGPAAVDNAGALSPYGTMAQGGNVFEWMESANSAPNNAPGKRRSYRGGKWDNTSNWLNAASSFSRPPEIKNRNVGFRVASALASDPLVIVSAFPDREVLWPPDGKLYAIELFADVEGGLGEVELEVVGLESSEGAADLDMFYGVGGAVALRATRAGSGDGRVYTIWLQAVDEAGNTSEAVAVEVVVPHDRRARGRRERGGRR